MGMLFGKNKVQANVIINKIKNEMGYPTITNFLNTIAKWIADDELIILHLDRETMEKLKNTAKKWNCDNPTDWLKVKVGELLNDAR
jgi:hypothetical protein